VKPSPGAASPGRASQSSGEELLGKALDRTLLRRILACVWPQRRLLAGAALLLPVMTVLELAQPYLLKRAIDEHVVPGTLAGLDRLALLYLFALLGQYAAGFLHMTLTQAAGQRAMNDLRVRVYRHVFGLAQAYFDRTPLGRIMTRLTSDIEALSEMFASGLVSLVGDVVKIAFILVAIFGLDVRLALFSLASAPVLFVIAALFRKVVREAFREVRTRLALMNAFLQEHLLGVKIVQAFAQERLVARRFDEASSAYRRATARAIFGDAALYALVEAVGSIAVAGLLWHGGARIAAGTLSFGVLVAFIEYLTKLFAPIRELSTKYTVMQQAMAAAERVFDLLDTDDPDAPPAPAGAAIAPPTPTSSAAPPSSPPSSPASPPPHLALAGVSFAYRAGQPVLRDVSFSVARGETLAVVGPTGGGKSTLVRLATRLYDPQEGAVLLDGEDVRRLPPRELRRRVVVVTQEPFLFSGTLTENITLEEPVPAARVEEALWTVGAAHLLERPGGLQAPVGERGARFSAGERQLVAFARALCRAPELLLLDEATANVDPETERLLEQGIAALLRGRTSIVIAHRFSTLGRADRILVLDGGRVAEEGSHAALMTRGGLYARLARLQGRERLAPPAAPPAPAR
jgi:ATP-binding cassette, subfamily B, multidrug efflux pump